MGRYEPDTTWFLAQLKPNCAQVASRNLARQGFETFLPLEEVTRRAGSKFVTAVQPMFPGYIFVAFDIAQGGWRAINGTYGITRLVGFGKDPAPVPAEIISGLMGRCDTQGKFMASRPLAPGDQVTIPRGPFVDFVGEVEKIAPDARVWVLLDLMGGKMRVSVPAEELRPA